MNGTHDNTRQAAADEMRAYDLLQDLLRVEGTTTVLATLRAWHVLRALNRPPQRPPRAVTGVTGHIIKSSI